MSRFKFILLLSLIIALGILSGRQIYAVTSRLEPSEQSITMHLADEFAAHKALYDVSMIESKNGTQLANVCLLYTSDAADE